MLSPLRHLNISLIEQSKNKQNYINIIKECMLL